jgi:hypothetical protein
MAGAFNLLTIQALALAAFVPAVRVFLQAASGNAPTLSMPDNPTTKSRRWYVAIFEGRVQRLGAVEAADEKAAEAVAIEKFAHNEEQRSRLMIWEQ